MNTHLETDIEYGQTHPCDQEAYSRDMAKRSPPNKSNKHSLGPLMNTFGSVNQIQTPLSSDSDDALVSCKLTWRPKKSVFF